MVPVYDGQAHLPGFFDRLDAQHRPDMEVVLVDDGSTDDTASLIAAFTSRTSWRCRSVRLPTNGGLGEARRAGFEAASAPLLMCLDVDDVLRPGALDAVAGAAQSAGPGEVLVFDFAYLTNGERTVVPGMVSEVCEGPNEALRALLRDEITPFMWNKVIPRQGLVASDFSGRRQGEDLPTLVRVFQVHQRVRRVPVVMLDYVIADSSLSHTGDLVRYTSPVDGQLAEVRSLLEGSGLWRECAEDFEGWCRPRVLVNAALASSRRHDGRFAQVRTNVVAQTDLRGAVRGLRSGARRYAALLLLVHVAPPVFRLVARVSARRRGRAGRER